MNILDYLDWRGDLSFARDPFNEVDNLILSILAYLEFDGIVSKKIGGSSIPLSKVADRLTETKDTPTALSYNSFLKQIPKLLLKASESIRFKNIQLSCYVNQMDYELAKQFSAVVFSLSQDLHFIAFRGTDDSLIGWKEDFQMSFMDEVQGQKQAVIYFERILNKLSGHYYLGGHSKGGNLAVYAATQAPDAMRERIIGIYNNDGPGFQATIIQSEGYQSILRKISTLIPKSSVVGMLLEHCEEYKIVDSSEMGLLQHNAFSWEVKGTSFVYEKGLTKGSLNLNTAVRAWLNQLSLEQRALFVDAMFKIILSTGAKTVRDLSRVKLVMANEMIKSYKNMDPLTQSHLKKTMEIFFMESQKVFRHSLSEDIGSFLTKNPAKRKLQRTFQNTVQHISKKK